MTSLLTPGFQQIVIELRSIYEKQRDFLTSAPSFETKMDLWHELSSSWSQHYALLDIYLKNNKMTDEETGILSELLDDHNQFIETVKHELIKLTEQINVLKRTQKAKNSYENSGQYTADGVFYDERK